MKYLQYKNTGKNKRSVVKGKGRSNIRITAANPSEEFVKDEKGAVKSLILYQNGQEVPGAKIK